MPEGQNNTDQMQRINFALNYTDGDMDKARLMVAGQYNDVRILKCKFSVVGADTFGVMLLFLNFINSYTPALQLVLISEQEQYDKMKTVDNWKIFFKTFQELKGSENMIESNDLLAHIYSSVDGYDLYSFAINKDIEGLSETLSEITAKFYNLDSIEYQIDLEDTSSLAMSENKIPFIDKQSSEEEAETEEVEDNRPQVEKDADFIIEAECIVSPIKGKYVNEIRPGDLIKMSLVSKSGISRKVAVALNSITDEGEFLPIKGRVKEIVPMEKGGHTIYCQVAKGVLAKIIEEENVKIALATPKRPVEEPTKKQSSANMTLYIVMLFGLIIISVLIIYVLV